MPFFLVEQKNLRFEYGKILATHYKETLVVLMYKYDNILRKMRIKLFFWGIETN